MRIVCLQTILMKYPTLFFSEKLGMLAQILPSAAVVIAAFRVKVSFIELWLKCNIILFLIAQNCLYIHASNLLIFYINYFENFWCLAKPLL